MNAVMGFLTALNQAEQDLEQTADTLPSIESTLQFGLGLARGYFLAGNISTIEYGAGCDHLKRIARSRRAAIELRDAALAEGLA